MFDGVFEFAKFLDAFRNVQRHIPLPDGRGENDAEHSYQLAMICWYVNLQYKLGLDEHQVLLTALTHDLVEVYAGDTFAFTNNKDHLDSKESRETEAIERMQKEFAHIPQLLKVIGDYKNKNTREARFVYAIDKMMPSLVAFAASPNGFAGAGVDRQRYIAETDPKVAKSKEATQFWNELKDFLNQQPPGDHY